jgi:hypothetical protein
MKVIHIYSVYNGLQENTNTGYCALSSTVVQSACFFDVSFVQVSSLCESQSSCSIQLFSYTFGNPCLGSPNQQLFIQYQCVDPVVLTRQISTCSSNKTVSSICPASLPTGHSVAYACQPNALTITCPTNTYIFIYIFIV